MGVVLYSAESQSYVAATDGRSRAVDMMTSTSLTGAFVRPQADASGPVSASTSVVRPPLTPAYLPAGTPLYGPSGTLYPPSNTSVYGPGGSQSTLVVQHDTAMLQPSGPPPTHLLLPTPAPVQFNPSSAAFQASVQPQLLVGQATPGAVRPIHIDSFPPPQLSAGPAAAAGPPAMTSHNAAAAVSYWMTLN